ncbi:MAG: hypothetical protein ACFE8V_07470 [Promethearchaeota archaeon]
MRNNKYSIYSIAKNISYEILIEEQLQLKSEAIDQIFAKYRKKKRSLKLKFLSYKIINSIIFVILPIFPLIAFLGITNSLTEAGADPQIIVFIQSFVLQTYFLLQFFDFFLMGVFNLMNIMSGEIFEWFKTLPLSRKELKRVTLLTIIHNFDIPILTNILTFPIMLYFVTQNYLAFLISLGCSVINVMFSISILIILGEKLANVIKLQTKKVRKALSLQILNVFSYSIIIFGSIFAIQMGLNSLISIIVTSANLYHSPLYNLILSFIPFPFSPTYLICFFINAPEMTINIWLSPLFGMSLYLILLYFFFKKAMNSINNILSLKYKFNKYIQPEKELTVRIHKVSPIKAFIRKDLLIASRNIQTFMSFLMPTIMSFVFIIFFNISYGQGALLGGDLFYNWLVIVGFSPVLSGVIVYNILNIENTGKSITAGLPIINRDQAKAKLLIMSILQIIATITPILVYVLDPRFMDLFLTILATLPFVFIFLMLIFLLRIRFFGKRRASHVLDEISPENKMIKWIIIFLIIYLMYFLLVSIAYFLYFYFDYFILIFNLGIISLALIGVIKGIFDKVFSKVKFKQLLEEQVAERMKITKWPILIIIFVIVFYLSSILYVIEPTFISVNPQLFTGIFFVVLSIILAIVSLKIPKKKKTHSEGN